MSTSKASVRGKNQVKKDMNKLVMKYFLKYDPSSRNYLGKIAKWNAKWKEISVFELSE